MINAALVIAILASFVSVFCLWAIFMLADRLKHLEAELDRAIDQHSEPGGVIDRNDAFSAWRAIDRGDAQEAKRILADVLDRQHSEPGREDVKEKYHELLYEVATKHPGESRHETALRYIREAENRPTYCGYAPPQRRDALEALERVKEVLSIAAPGDYVAYGEDDCDLLRRHLTAPPTEKDDENERDA